MKKFKIYSSIFAFIFAIGSVCATAFSSTAEVQGYNMLAEGGSVNNEEECDPIKNCETTGAFRCRFKPVATEPAIALFQDDGNGVCDLAVNDDENIE